MKPLLLFMSLLVLDLSIGAQTKKVFKINPGDKPYDVLPKDEMYRYAAFTDGKVLMRDGSSATAKLNYNSLFGEMQFIDPKGDTLSLADEGNIASISIKTDTFYYAMPGGCVELLIRFGKMKLAKKKLLYISNKEDLGPLGTVNSGGGVETYQYMSSRTYLKDLIAQEILTFSEKMIYFIGDRFNHFELLNRKNLLKMYSERKKDVSNYLDKNNIDLNNEEDLKKLCIYLGEPEVEK